MSERHKQHLGRSEDDESEIRGRDYAAAGMTAEEAEQAAEEGDMLPASDLPETDVAAEQKKRTQQRG
ncbi:hypothetical protein BH20GEM2_BH20GEM2_06050 [soil metagenome]|jgi:hypothetical protein